MSLCNRAQDRNTQRRVGQCLDYSSAIVKPVHECDLQKSHVEPMWLWYAPSLVFDTLEDPPRIKTWCLSAAFRGQRSSAKAIVVEVCAFRRIGLHECTDLETPSDG